MPRPAGRSGCVSTSADVEARGVQARERDARELGRAGEGDSHRLAGRRHQTRASSRVFFSILRLDAVALERAQVFDEHLADQMVHLVLHADREQARRRRTRATRPSRSSARTRTRAWRATLS